MYEYLVLSDPFCIYIYAIESTGWPANGWHEMSYKKHFLFAKKAVSHTTFVSQLTGQHKPRSLLRYWVKIQINKAIVHYICKFYKITLLTVYINFFTSIFVNFINIYIYIYINFHMLLFVHSLSHFKRK